MNGGIEQNRTYPPENRSTEYFDHLIAKPQVAVLGPTISRTDIPSSLGPFDVMPEYKTKYPETVIQALTNLYREYNQAFVRLLRRIVSGIPTINTAWGQTARPPTILYKLI